MNLINRFVSKEIPKEYKQLADSIKKFVDAELVAPKKLSCKLISIDKQRSIIKVKVNGDNRVFSEGSTVLVNNEMIGVVEFVAFDEASIKIEEHIGTIEDEIVSIDFNLMNIVLERLNEVAEKISKGQTTNPILEILTKNAEVYFSDRQLGYLRKNFNIAQRNAIFKAINCNDFHLIIGPPGSGKTFVASEITNQYLTFSETRCVLLTSFTNLAVDNMLQQVLNNCLNLSSGQVLRVNEKDDSFTPEQILRIGDTRKINPELRKFSLEQKISEHPYSKEIDSLQKKIKELQSGEIKLKQELNEIHIQISAKHNENAAIIESITALESRADTVREKFVGLHCNTSNFPELDILEKRIEENKEKIDGLLSLTETLVRVDRISAKIGNKPSVSDAEFELLKMDAYVIALKLSSMLKDNKKTIEKIDSKKKLLKEYAELKRNATASSKHFYLGNKPMPLEDASELALESYTEISQKYENLKMPKVIESLENEYVSFVKDFYAQYLNESKTRAEALDALVKRQKTEMHLLYNQKDELLQMLDGINYTIEQNYIEIHRIKEKIIEDILGKTRIVAATVIGSGIHWLKDMNFSLTIMDEASQVPSYLALIPLMKSNKFVLIGDNKQLQPIEEKKIDPELGLSIFNRLETKYPSNTSFLDTQYRMSEEIAKISSNVFYNGNLKTFEEIKKSILPFKSKSNLLRLSDPVTFFDTSAKCKTNKNFYETRVGDGCYNEGEAEFTKKIVENFIDIGFQKEDIGVITPYRKQRQVIQEKIALPIEIETIYKFQGRERKIIIISLVNSRIDNKTSKFIEKPTQLNVALTRAKQKMIIIGNIDTLRSSGLYKKIIEQIAEKNITAVP